MQIYCHISMAQPTVMQVRASIRKKHFRCDYCNKEKLDLEIKWRFRKFALPILDSLSELSAAFSFVAVSSSNLPAFTPQSHCLSIKFHSQ